jgi:hypothetical protein
MQKIESDNFVYYFNKWLRISLGAAVIGAAIYYKEWIPAIPGVIFIVQGIFNLGCHGSCYIAKKSLLKPETNEQ